MLNCPTKTKQQDNWACPQGCALCVQACPTGRSLLRKIQPKRCISYLTQMSGPIPWLRGQNRPGLWGCDICQQVCPVNQTAQPSRHRSLVPGWSPHRVAPLLDLTKQEFTEQFGRTSMAWRGKNVLARNACIILGNQGKAGSASFRKTAREHPAR